MIDDDNVIELFNIYNESIYRIDANTKILNNRIKKLEMILTTTIAISLILFIFLLSKVIT